MSLGISVALTPLVRSFAHRHGLYDQPGARKVHSQVVPRLGGVAIAVAFAIPVMALLVYLNRIGEQLAGQEGFLIALVGGGIPILLLGVWDDVRGCGHKVKFVVQIAVAVFTVFIGVDIDSITVPGVGKVELDLLSPVITVLWIVGIINAINLIDGLDGLASGVCFFALLTLFFSGLVDDNVVVCVVSTALAGAIVGFLFFNFNPATIFMGDSGSMFLGYVLATLSIATTSKSATLVALTVPLLALGLPIFDTFFAIIRRLYLRRPVFSADRGHLHHRLLALGFNQRQAVVSLYIVCSILAATGIVMRVTRNPVAGLGLFFVGVVVFVIMHTFHLRELMATRGTGKVQAFETRIRERALVDLREIGKAVRVAESMSETWAHLKKAAELLQLTKMEISLHIRPNEEENLEHELSYNASVLEIEGRPVTLVVPLEDGEFLYGEIRFVFCVVKGVDVHRRAMMYLLAEYLMEFFSNAYAGRTKEIFLVQQHPAALDADRVVVASEQDPLSGS